MMDPTQGSWVRLLADAGVPLGTDTTEALLKHLDLVREWNSFANLVSDGDIEYLLERHLVDALSLAPYLTKISKHQGSLLDIGSGGGFPAIPLRLILPGLRVTLVERSSRKVGILRKMLGTLGLTDVDILHGEFPICPPGGLRGYTAMTARAVERSAKFSKLLAPRLPGGTIFFCQSGETDDFEKGGLHVSEVRDEWTQANLRRGSLHLVWR
jgi:16S rRNA (guanine527-N7)-methyltransferase